MLYSSILLRRRDKFLVRLAIVIVVLLLINLFSFIDPLQSVLIRFVSLLSNLETQFGPNSKKYSTSDMNVVWSPFCFLLLLLLCHFCFNDIPFIRSHKCVFVTMLNSLLESKVVE